MKRILILLFSAFVATMLYAQIPLNKDCYEYNAKPSFLLSRYNNYNQNIVLKMQASATLVFDISDLLNMQEIKEIASAENLTISGISEQVGGKTDSATFEVRVDPDSVYDCSYKIYSAKFKDCKIKYITYSQADKLSVILKDKEYALSCIDGGMDVHIKYLSHKYIPRTDGEKLYISITKDLPLKAADKSTILLKRGSIISFDIFDFQHK